MKDQWYTITSKNLLTIQSKTHPITLENPITVHLMQRSPSTTVQQYTYINIYVCVLRCRSCVWPSWTIIRTCLHLKCKWACGSTYYACKNTPIAFGMAKMQCSHRFRWTSLKCRSWRRNSSTIDVIIILYL